MPHPSAVQASSGPQPTRRVPGLDRWLLIVLLLLAFGRGVWQLGGKSLWWDESLSLHRAQGSLPYVLSNRIVLTDTLYDVPTIDNHPPLYFLLLWGTVRLLGQSEFALRFPSLIFAVLLVPLLYVSGRRLIDRWAGLGAAALAAVSPMYLWYGQEARPYTMLAFFSLLSFYLFVRVFFGREGLSELRRRWPWLAAYLLVTVGLVLTHHLSILLIGVQLLVLGLALLHRARRNRALLIVVGGIAMVAAVSAAYAFLTLPRPKASAGYRFVPLWEILRDVWNSFSLGLSVDVGDWYVLLIDLVFLIFLAAGFLRLVRPGASPGWRRSGWLLAGYLAIPIGAIYTLSFLQPAYMNSRHLILITPAFYLLLASGLTLWRGRAWAVGLLAWLVVIGGVTYSTYNYFADPTYDKDHHRQWGDYLREHVRPGDVVIVDPPHIETLYHYYADAGVPWVGLPLLSASRPETVAKMEELLETYDRVWLAFSNTPPWGDRRRFPEAWLNDNAFRVFYQHFPSYASIVMVAGYLPDWPHASGLPADATPLPVRYTPALRLEGYRFVSSPEPGKALHVELFWGTDELGPEQVSAMLRLLDAEGHVLAQDDQCPFNGLYPMWQWQPDLLLQDEHEIPIPYGTPPGRYELELTLLSRPNGCAEGSGPAVPPLEAPPHVQRGDGLLLGTVDVPPAGSRSGRHEFDDIENESEARFDGLTLLGSQVSPLQVEPSGLLDVVLYWEAHRSGLPDSQFHLRLLDPSEQVVQERLIRPVGDAYPTTLWSAGDRYVGRFWFSMPADAEPGRYRLEIVPQPPLQRAGLLAALGRLIGRGTGVPLADVQVLAGPAAPPLVPPESVPLPTGLQIDNPMNYTLGERVRFLGYEVDSDQVLAGETLGLTLYWQALNPMVDSYSVFTHLLGPSNEILGQQDGVPQGGSYPTSQWQPGEVVVDRYELVVDPGAPLGLHPLEIGLYRPTDGVRLPVVDEAGQPVPEDRILLGPIAVVPPSGGN